MLTTPLAAAAPARVDELLRAADAARLARQASSRSRRSARLLLPAELATALREGLRRRRSPSRSVCCA